MQVNLIPPEMRPARPSPVPYMPLLGLIAISAIWLVTQLATAGVARRDCKKHRNEYQQLSTELGQYRELPGRIAHAEAERDELQHRAAAATAITHTGFSSTPLLQVVAESLPANLRLTALTVDYPRRQATILGYGSEEKTDLEVATFLRALNANRYIRRTFAGAELDYCNSRARNERSVKQFSISLRFREPRLAELIQEEAPAEEE
ncbi:MAG: hypothetical protein R6V58_02000 [Planctomycetota bacterium]